MSRPDSTEWLRPERIAELLAQAPPPATQIRAALAKARELQGLDLAEAAALAAIADPAQLEELFATARFVKESIYGRRMVLFAPLYISSVCGNECAYCAFRKSNRGIERHALTLEQIQAEARLLVEQGQKRVLLVAGEGYPAARGGFRYVLEAINAVYAVTHERSNIRRLNVNVAPLSEEDFRRLRAAEIGTYQLFQETYHRPTYAAVHTAGRKTDFDWRLGAMDRAMCAGIDDVGLGALFGLTDWRFDLLALLQHNRHLEQAFGVGAHTISVPRIEPATGSPYSEAPPAAVGDLDFKKIIAILRLAVPYTGIILSTRESAQMRREACALGVSQLSAGSRTAPGGYAAGAEEAPAHNGQFQLGDHRSLEDVVQELAQDGYLPSFCTACYRLGRTGGDFMDLAKPGLIREKCDPNAVTTFLEYLSDYAAPATCAVGERTIAAQLAAMAPKTRRNAEKMLMHIRQGKRDVYC